MEGATLLSIASGKGNLDMVNYFISKGADINNNEGKDGGIRAIPLGVAIIEGHFNIVKYLVENGADIDMVVNISGQPILDFVNECGDPEIIEYFNSRK